ncbi:bifunctional diguanylate cyclase/phosphodiesterase [Bacillus fonticola]|uniref:bifunctional diguanylate cyclase/phosphodiesterase n=1 Tax=Bacillus fonticola TaxID=2728853 RepID=UPI00147641D1|nr:EAL domain-containing protein [Bacillus fonticola]
MRTIQHVYQDKLTLERFTRKNHLAREQTILVQVFSGVPNRAFLRMLQKDIQETIPHAIVMGVTTDGEIYQGTNRERQVVLAFTVFTQTEVQLFSIETKGEDLIKVGQAFTKLIKTPHTKGVLLFSGLSAYDSQLFLDGLYDSTNEFPPIVGGLAADNGQFQEAFVFTEDWISSTGILLVTLRSEQLTVSTHGQYHWREVGTRFTATGVNGKEVFSLDGELPSDLLKKHIGERFIQGLPETGIEFPLVIMRGEEQTQAFIESIQKDGTMTLSTPLHKGEQVTFAFVDIEKWIETSVVQLETLSEGHVESIFIYNCLARRRYVKEITSQDVAHFQRIAPTTGFFGNGQIVSLSGGKPKVYVHALAYVTMAEGQTIPSKKEALKVSYQIPPQVRTMMLFTQLMEAAVSNAAELAQSVQRSQEIYKSLFENNSELIYSTDLTGKFTSINPSFEQAFNVKKEDLIGKSAIPFLQKKDVIRVKRHFLKSLIGREELFRINIETNGTWKTFEMKHVPIMVQGERIGLYGLGRDITDKIQTEDRITQLAYYDHETQLPNRIKFAEIVKGMLDKVKSSDQSIAVMFLDIDRFKIINDSLGHVIGDLLLKQIAYRIEKVLPAGAYIGRFGGDKFTIACARNVSYKQVESVAQMILDEVKQPLFHDGHEFFLTASIGVSFSPQDGDQVETLLRNADAAMNRAKQVGGGAYMSFSHHMNDDALYRLELERFLHKAIEKDELFLAYQPILELSTGKCTGYEALVRWRHPHQGIIPPTQFIPIAEETGLILEIGNWVLQEACQKAVEWREQLQPDLKVSVNVSAPQFAHPKFAQFVQKACEQAGLPPEALHLELTESIMVGNMGHCIDVMYNLKDIGVNISIDDFGTGYSSFQYLRELPIDTLKIDRSFIHSLENTPKEFAIVQALVTMGTGLGIRVIAEGVETKEQLDLLQQIGLNYAQGFYFSKPLEEQAFQRALEKNTFAIEMG